MFRTVRRRRPTQLPALLCQRLAFRLVLCAHASLGHAALDAFDRCSFVVRSC